MTEMLLLLIIIGGDPSVSYLINDTENHGLDGTVKWFGVSRDGDL